MSNIKINFELGGFAEEVGDIDGDEKDFNAFNFCLAQEYASTMYDEDFKKLGECSTSLLDNICYWIAYNGKNEDVELRKAIRTGTLITKNNRTFIDAIYENKNANLACMYLNSGVYSPKLVMAIVLYNGECYYTADIGENSFSQAQYKCLFEELYKFIDSEYEKSNCKKEFLNTIKSNFGRIRCHKSYKSSPIPNVYNWTNDLLKEKAFIKGKE